MKTVRFNYGTRSGWVLGYTCSEPGEMSGEYVPAADVRELVDAAWKNGFNYGFSEGMIEARPYSKGGHSADTCWPKSKTFRELKSALERIGEQK